MLYYLQELQRMSIAPARLVAEATKLMMTNPFNPFATLYYDSGMGSIPDIADVMEMHTRRYEKPDWGLETTTIDGETVAVAIEKPLRRAWCELLRFKRESERDDPKVLLVAPYAGHYATLLRGTVERLLPAHDVYVTDWIDARLVPFGEGRFDFFDFMDYVIAFLHYLGPNTHVVTVCQPAVPVMAAVAQMSGWDDNCVPASLTLIGGPVDPRKSVTAMNRMAMEYEVDWFERKFVADVPPPHPGMFRKVYPGYLQLSNFVLFGHLLLGDEDPDDRKREFFSEYQAVLDLPAEFYLSTLEIVFQQCLLTRGELVAGGHPVRPEKIERTAILCIEGELDDISGVGQTRAALDITPNLPSEMKRYHLQKGAGHYGIFNGSKWRKEIAPIVEGFIREHDHEVNAKPAPRRRSAKPAPEPVA